MYNCLQPQPQASLTADLFDSAVPVSPTCSDSHVYRPRPVRNMRFLFGAASSILLLLYSFQQQTGLKVTFLTKISFQNIADHHRGIKISLLAENCVICFRGDTYSYAEPNII
jgi:hypothetical protein